MAWRCSGASNASLVQNLWRNSLVTDPTVRDALLRVDRAHYSPKRPYEDAPQPIGFGATISAPHMHASALEHLLPFARPSAQRPAPRALDIGSGSGYLTHVLAELVGPRGLVVGLEHITALRNIGEENMRRSEDGRRFLDEGIVRMRVGDGRIGWQEDPRPGEEAGGTRWDVIHVGAAAREVHPQLIEQLNAPGCMFIPVDDDDGSFDSDRSQSIWRIEKDEAGKISKKRLFGVRYVPLTSAPNGA